MKKILSLALIVMLAVGLLAGCGQKTTEQPQQEETQGDAALTGKVVIAGSTSVQPLSDELAAAFTEKNPDVQIEVQGGGSSVGVKSAIDKIVDIGMSSRDLKEEEKSSGLTEYVIAKDGIAVVVNPTSKVEDLTIEQIKKIFTGEITNWKEVGGEDKAITVVSREEGSGTRGAFIEITGVEGKDASGNKADLTTKNALVQPSTGAVKQTVANTPDSIGYVSMGALDDAVKTVKVEGVEATEENAKDGSFKISRPFLFLTNGEESETVKAFIEFIMSAEGQEIVAQEFISVK
ncbi:MAG: phosphate-binding protein [Anaerosolibacter sp.]|jgi:phosphate transport system substrate-binding protein|uniref:phosphate ABC transporter substrate-binding protein n=1 Tax=Anaerosolibacter sp. TaxID=1872527 RepID=UPI00261EF7A2|nr:phosphate ABC transporter substrate-binding protein PstS family protein [Anaerosolibacter sp.]MDF2546878.1 phosphate-binding protein [Anaerosolibacter sp.]